MEVIIIIAVEIHAKDQDLEIEEMQAAEKKGINSFWIYKKNCKFSKLNALIFEIIYDLR